MKRICIALGLAAMLVTPATAQNFKRITTEAEFVSAFAGKKYGNDTGWFRAAKNGKVTGKFGKDRLKGAWAWKQGFFCRTVTLGKGEAGNDCQVIEKAGSTMRLTRGQGKGRKVIYKPQ